MCKWKVFPDITKTARLTNIWDKFLLRQQELKRLINILVNTYLLFIFIYYPYISLKSGFSCWSNGALKLRLEILVAYEKNQLNPIAQYQDSHDISVNKLGYVYLVLLLLKNTNIWHVLGVFLVLSDWIKPIPIHERQT